MDTQEINYLYEKSHTFLLNSDLVTTINSATLGVDTLKFMGSLVEYYQIQSVFEFGSGLSTRFFAHWLRDRHTSQIHSLENSAFYWKKTTDMLIHENVSVYLGKIRPYQFQMKTFATYNNATIQNIPVGTKPDLILIDGPSGRRFGREATLYQIAHLLTPQTIILLDDSNRPSEQEALANWQRVWQDGIDIIEFPNLKNGFTVLQLKNPKVMATLPFSAIEVTRSWYKVARQLGRYWVKDRG